MKRKRYSIKIAANQLQIELHALPILTICVVLIIVVM